jgi:hypothetical protein
MEEEPDGPDEKEPTEPPPFNPDPELIAYLEHDGKPTREEVRRMVSEPRHEILPRLRRKFSRVRAGTSLSEEPITERHRESQQDR